MAACAEPGCKVAAISRGYCRKHYARHLRTTGLLKPERIAPGTTEAFIRGRLEYEGDECTPWPFSKSDKGYGRATVAGEDVNAHRAMCILAHGPPPFHGAEAAHTCGNADCITKRHLYWATSTENNQDKSAHGTQVWGEQINTAKLTAEIVQFIRKADMPDRELAARFNVDVTAVHRARTGRTWKRA